METATAPYLALVLASTFDPHIQDDIDRAEEVRELLRLHRGLLVNLLDDAEYLLFDCTTISGWAPPMTRLISEVRRYAPATGPVAELLRQVIALAVTSPRIGVEDVTKAIEDLDAARTFSGSNPDGPVRRGEDGFYLDGSHPPTVSGSPTERLLWIVLYHQMKFHNYISVAELTVQLGACQAAMLAAVRSLEARGVAQSCTDSPGCPGHHVRLCRAYTRQAANDRAAWQVEYEAKCERDAWVKDHLEVDPDSSPNITEGSYAAARKMVVDAALAASSATTTEVAE